MNISAKNIYDFFMITFGTVLVSAAVFFFLMPCGLAVGSISGLAIVLGNFVALDVSVITMSINVVLIIIGFIFIGKNFGVKTVYTSILMPGMLFIFERIFPNMQSLTGEPFVDMVCYIFVLGFAQSILFNRNASSGGLDIIGMILHKYTSMDIGKAMSVAGFVIALTSAFAYDKKIVVISVLGTYVSGMVLDYFIFGSRIKKRVCIISQKHEEVRNYLINELDVGATMYETMGAYDQTRKTEIITIVSRHKFSKLMNRVPEIDPDAFMTVYNVNEIVQKRK